MRRLVYLVMMKSGFDYDGSFQVIGVGRYAVYAISSTYSMVTSSTTSNTVTATASATTIAFVASRHLVALNANGGVLPQAQLLPSLEVPSRAEVKVSSVGDDGLPDVIAFVDSVATPLIFPPIGTTAVPLMPVAPRTVRLWSFKGSAFQQINTTPITLP